MLESINSNWIIIAFSGVIILSFLFNVLSKKANIPSVLLLIASGMLISFGLDSLGIVKINLMPVLEFIGVVGLIMIVLEAALDLKLKKEKRGLILRSLLIALMLLIFTSFLIAFIFSYFIHLDPYTALVYAVPLSIMSSAIIIPSVGNLSKENKEFMIYESTFSDILGIMFFYFLLDSRNIDSTQAIVLNISSNIIITLIVSVVVSYILVFLLQYIKTQGRLFLTISMLMLLYAIGKLFHLSSLIIILTFGLILNNEKLFIRGFFDKIIDKEEIKRIMRDFKTLTEESSFVVRTFFFVLFGMSIDLSTMTNPFIYFITALIIIVLYSTRYINLKLINRSSNAYPMLFIAPRGLITILLFFAIPIELQADHFDKSILLLTILSTSVIMMIVLITSGTKMEDIDEVEMTSGRIIDGVGLQDPNLTNLGYDGSMVRNSPDDEDSSFIS